MKSTNKLKATTVVFLMNETLCAHSPQFQLCCRQDGVVREEKHYSGIRQQHGSVQKSISSCYLN